MREPEIEEKWSGAKDILRLNNHINSNQHSLEMYKRKRPNLSYMNLMPFGNLTLFFNLSYQTEE